MPVAGRKKPGRAGRRSGAQSQNASAALIAPLISSPASWQALARSNMSSVQPDEQVGRLQQSINRDTLQHREHLPDRLKPVDAAKKAKHTQAQRNLKASAETQASGSKEMPASQDLGKEEALKTNKAMAGEQKRGLGLRAAAKVNKPRGGSAASSEDSDEEIVVFSGRNKVSSTITEQPRVKPKTNAQLAYDDYVSNLLLHETDTDHEELSKTHENGAESTVVAEQASENTKEPTSGDDNNDPADDGWGSAELEDFDGFSTGRESTQGDVRVLRKRQRPRGIQYLVVARDVSVDEAQWLSKDKIHNDDAQAAIVAFDEVQEARDLLALEISEDEDEIMADDDLDALDFSTESEESGDDEDIDDDAALAAEIRMTDEQMAHLLNKQAELGFDGDDLMLFNGDGLLPASTSEEEARPLKYKTSGRKRSGKKSNLPIWFDGAESPDLLEGEDYDGFDIMDRDRASLQLPKGKKGRLEALAKMTPDVELQETLAHAWDNDRKKKKARKIEREMLRAEGLLSSNGKVDLRAKFKNGMSLEQVKTEIKAFISDDVREALALPPLDPNTRRVVHQTANKLNMSSKSNGSGASRYPVLYKKTQTLVASSEAFAIIDRVTRFSKSEPTRSKIKSKGKGKSSPKISRAAMKDPPRLRRTGGQNAASYHDGEVVGVGAPELGTENKGRAMLEKMGWSHGTALGALNNKGIMQPVEQVIKISKAGLS